MASILGILSCLILISGAGAETVAAHFGGSVQEQATASIVVQVTDEAGRPVADTEVFLVISDGQQVVDEMTGATVADGTAAFTDIAIGEGYTALPVTTFDGSPYQGERTPLTAGQQAIAAINVFNSSDVEGNLHIDILHIIMTEVEPGLYQAIQVMSVLNVGQMASLAGPEIEGRRAGLIIPLPSGVSNASPIPQMSGLDPVALRVEADRMLHFLPVPPGSTQIAIAYDLVAGEDGADVTLSVPYPTAQLSLLVGPGIETVAVSSDQMEELPPQEIPGQGVYGHWTSDVLNAGDMLTFHIGPRRELLSVESVSVLVLAMALLAVVAASLWGRRKDKPVAEPIDRGQLIAEVARLDADHRAGRIDDATHQAQRAEAIETLTALDRDSGE